eukprot:184239-Chlamydomonas_euryale.AAC.1
MGTKPQSRPVDALSNAIKHGNQTSKQACGCALKRHQAWKPNPKAGLRMHSQMQSSMANQTPKHACGRTHKRRTLTSAVHQDATCDAVVRDHAMHADAVREDDIYVHARTCFNNGWLASPTAAAAASAAASSCRTRSSRRVA